MSNEEIYLQHKIDHNGVVYACDQYGRKIHGLVGIEVAAHCQDATRIYLEVLSSTEKGKYFTNRFKDGGE